MNCVSSNSSQYGPVWSTLLLYLFQVLTLIPLHFNNHIQQGPLRPTVILFHIYSLPDELCIFKLLPIWTCMVHSAPLSLSSTYTDPLHFNNHIQQGPLRPTVILFHIYSLPDELCIFILLPIWTGMVYGVLTCIV
jgi:hypothetical protein